MSFGHLDIVPLQDEVQESMLPYMCCIRRFHPSVRCELYQFCPLACVDPPSSS